MSNFKVGDWVTCSLCGDIPYRISNETILKHCTNGNRKNVKLWHPKEGEYVFLLTKDSFAYPVLRQYNQQLIDDMKFMNENDYKGTRYLTPFLGELPE